MAVDASELRALIADLRDAPNLVRKEARSVISKGALNIKNDTRENISDDPSWKRLAQTVNYEQVGLSAIVGYDDQGQGELAGIHEFGSSRRGPHPTLYPAAEREAPKFEKAMGDASAKALRDLL